MKREQVFLPEDIRTEEVLAMAHSIGCFVRCVNGFVFIDRVPGIVRKEAPANLIELRKAKK